MSKFVIDLAKELKVTREESKILVESIFNFIKNKCENDGKVMITGFGQFYVKTRKSRTHYIPKTGETFEVGERKVLAFKPSKNTKYFDEKGCGGECEDCKDCKECEESKECKTMPTV